MGYYEVDWLLTLYVETERGQCSQLGGIVVESEAQCGWIGEASVDLEHTRGCFQAEDWTQENKRSGIALGERGWGRWWW